MEKQEFDPKINDKMIAIWKCEDGNYKGLMQKNGKLITARTNDPQTVLLALLTNDGK